MLSIFVLPEMIRSITVKIDDVPSSQSAFYSGSSPTSVFVSDSAGYQFYIDSTRKAVYAKTTNGGASWGSAVVVDNQTDVSTVAVWFDQWTPGDTGTVIHVLTGDRNQDNLWYTSVDTATDTVSTTVSISANESFVLDIVEGRTGTSITKATNGVLYAGATTPQNDFVVKCSASCSTGTNWVEAGSNPYTNGNNNDWISLVPLPDDDILTVFFDASANALYSKEYEDVSDAWDGSFITIDTGIDENGTFDGTMSLTLEPDSGDVYLAYLDNLQTVGANDAIKTAIYDGSSWTAATSPIPDSGESGLMNVSLGLDVNTDTVYLAYVYADDYSFYILSSNIYYVFSTDAMSTWSAPVGPINEISNTIYAAQLPFASSENLHVSWFDNNYRDFYSSSAVDLTDGESEVLFVQHEDTQADVFTESTTNNYIGAAFKFQKNTGSGNVTSITFTERSHIDADTYIENVDIRYEASASCTYNGDETLFGTTANFSGEQVTVTGTMPVSTANTCVYFIFDTAADADGVLDISIENPSDDIAVSSGVVVQNAEVNLDGVSLVKKSDSYTASIIDAEASSRYSGFTSPMPNVVFVNEDVGYAFFIDFFTAQALNYCKYTKTTDGGETWSTPVNIDPQNDCFGISVWYDQWTPGDTSGSTIHIVTADTGEDDVWYTAFDTTDDSFTTSVNASNNSGQTSVLSDGRDGPSITKSTDGTLYISVADATDGFMIRCASSCETGTSWTEAGTNPYVASSRAWSSIMPLADGDILSIFWRDNSVFYSQEYDASANAWAGSWTTIESPVRFNSLYDAPFGTTIDKSTGRIYLAFVTEEHVLGFGDADIQTYYYNGSSWTQGANIVTNSVYPITSLSTAFDQTNEKVYVAYSTAGTPNNMLSSGVHIVSSDVNIGSWTQETGVLNNNSANRNVARVNSNLMSANRVFFTWYDEITYGFFGNTVSLTESAGTLSVDIVDAAGAAVASPSVSFSDADFSFGAVSTDGTLGTSSQKIRVENGTGTATWTLSLAASDPTDVWSDGGSNFYDFNDTTSSGSSDGGDTDSYAGLLSVDASGATVSPEAGCASTGISLGTATDFEEGVTDSITVASASGSTETGCYWDITGVDLSQTIPAEQPAGTYTLDFTLSIIAS